MEWNNLDMKIRKAHFFMSFKNSLLRVGQPTAMSMYGIRNQIGLIQLVYQRSKLNLKLSFETQSFKPKISISTIVFLQSLLVHS